jgi:hypothetical protein
LQIKVLRDIPSSRFHEWRIIDPDTYLTIGSLKKYGMATVPMLPIKAYRGLQGEHWYAFSGYSGCRVSQACL